MIFGRAFEGWSGRDKTYFELNQEYSHLAGIHWRAEHNAYCRFDEKGDIEEVVSVTTRGVAGVSLVSFKWPDLERYLAFTDCSLLRMFEFMLLRYENFIDWGTEPEELVKRSDLYVYRQKVSGDAAYTRGAQIIGLRRPKDWITDEFKSGGQVNKQYVEFLAYDFRNLLVTKISTDPKATTNYFEAKLNRLPLELSPAFFKPEVLSKYKADREKYKVTDREVSCRSSWSLRGYDLNDAGQVHAYICDLRSLPYSEQLYWLSYNEEPKASISKRAIINDFQGDFVTFQHPREAISALLQGWSEDGKIWWKCRDEALHERANPPVAGSRDEWSNAFLDLSQLLVEGFEINSIRKMLDGARVTYATNNQSLELLEILLEQEQPGSKRRLDGLRAAQKIRSKVKSHAGSNEGRELAEEALREHGDYGSHFRHVCEKIIDELSAIEIACGRYQLDN